MSLKWLVANQLNNSHFEVQHSNTGSSFRTVQLIRGDGTLSGEKTFSFTHETPKIGKNYYRLRQVDFDGTFDFSEVVLANIKVKKAANIFPNIIVNTEKIGVEINIGQRGIAQLQLTDMNGQVLLNESIQVEEGIHLHRMQIPSNLSAGIYFIHLQMEGTRLETHKLIKTTD